MKIIEKIKIFSLCDDFSQNEHEEMYDSLSAERGCDCYITYTANSVEKLEKKGYGDDPIANRLIELGAEEDEEVFIHIDY